jgi:hypothetical protein
MKGFKIIDIIKVVLGDILIELHFKIQNVKEKISFSICISDDGESILFSQKNDWIKLNDLKYETFSTISIDKTSSSDEFVQLINNEINNVQYGIGKTLDTNARVIYYLKITTDKNEFLFFNNGDQGAYSFERIDEILKHDIYNYEWVEELPYFF